MSCRLINYYGKYLTNQFISKRNYVIDLFNPKYPNEYKLPNNQICYIRSTYLLQMTVLLHVQFRPIPPICNYACHFKRLTASSQSQIYKIAESKITEYHLTKPIENSLNASLFREHF